MERKELAAADITAMRRKYLRRGRKFVRGALLAAKLSEGSQTTFKGGAA